MKKLLVTGDKGFIGKRVAEQFYGAGLNVDGCDYNEAVPNVSGYDLVIHLGAISSTNNRDAEAIYKQNYQQMVGRYPTHVDNPSELPLILCGTFWVAFI